ncbi:MAG: class I SAM-dependent methyltransferase [Microthrixaceae bacterium]
MVTAGIVEYDPDSMRFHLPPEHAALLTRAAGPQNLAAFTQFLPVIAEVEQDVIDCFSSGGGVGYEHYRDFHRTMGELSAMQFDAALVPAVLPLVPDIVGKLEAGIAVADVGCGRGHAVNLMAREFPESTFVGLDISEEVLGEARSEAAEMGLTNASFEHCDAPLMDRIEEYDFITTFDAVHDQVDPRGTVEAIHRALKPVGTWLCADSAASSELGDNVDHPLGPMMYTISCMHCTSVSLAGGGEGLGAMWGEQRARELFAAAGFEDITVRRVEGDVANNYYVCRRS